MKCHMYIMRAVGVAAAAGAMAAPFFVLLINSSWPLHSACGARVPCKLGAIYIYPAKCMPYKGVGGRPFEGGRKDWRFLKAKNKHVGITMFRAETITPFHMTNWPDHSLSIISTVACKGSIIIMVAITPSPPPPSTGSTFQWHFHFWFAPYALNIHWYSTSYTSHDEAHLI